MAKPAYKPGGVVKTMRGPDGTVYHAPYGFTAQQAEQIRRGVKGLPATMYPYPGFRADAKGSPAEQARLTEARVPGQNVPGIGFVSQERIDKYGMPSAENIEGRTPWENEAGTYHLTGSTQPSAGTSGAQQPYNPNAYVPGGSSPEVSKMIQDAGYGNVPFDWNKYIASDPILAGTLRQIQEAQIRQGSNLVGGAQQLYGRLGEMPTNLSPQLAALLGPEQLDALRGTINAGNQAGTTALARLQYGYRQAQSGSIGDLGARGLLRSSELAQHSNENLRGLTLGQYDARLGALDALQGLQGTYLAGQDTARAGIGTALTDAQKRAADLVNAGQLGGPYKPPATTGGAGTNPYMPPTAAPNMGMPRISPGDYGSPARLRNEALQNLTQGQGLHTYASPGPSGPSTSLTPKPPKPPAAPGLKTRFF